ncbi:MAG: hypothetical protein ACYT04_71910, partial [Nostoc sp.]
RQFVSRPPHPNSPRQFLSRPPHPNSTRQFLSRPHYTNSHPRLWKISQEHQQQELAREAIATQAEIKEAGFGSHFRSYVLKAVSGGVAIARRCWGLKDECEIPLSQLVFSG